MINFSRAFILFLILGFPAFCLSQTNIVSNTLRKNVIESSASKSSPAYAEVLLRKTEMQAELESLVIEYTEEYPKVLEIRYSLTVLQKETERIFAVKPAESSKLTLALGKLMVRKAELETDVWQLLKSYKEEHPDVKRAKRKVEIYEAAIREILG